MIEGPSLSQMWSLYLMRARLWSAAKIGIAIWKESGLIFKSDPTLVDEVDAIFNPAGRPAPKEELAARENIAKALKVTERELDVADRATERSGD